MHHNSSSTQILSSSCPFFSFSWLYCILVFRPLYGLFVCDHLVLCLFLCNTCFFFWRRVLLCLSHFPLQSTLCPCRTEPGQKLLIQLTKIFAHLCTRAIPCFSPACNSRSRPLLIRTHNGLPPASLASLRRRNSRWYFPSFPWAKKISYLIDFLEMTAQ